MNKKQAMNPYLPLWEYVPDAEPRVFGDRLYVYGSHDQAGAEQFCVNDYVVWSAPLSDLSDWKYEGISYTYEQTGADIEEAGNLAAPDCVQGSDGRYYLYYNRGARNACEVAVSEKPQGPFTYYGNITFADGTEPKAKLFDPGVLMDDDGRIYLYTGFVPTPESPWINVAGRYSLAFELESDMKTIKQGPVELLPGCLASKDTEFERHAFYEASSPRKNNGMYYMVYSSDQTHELCYAVSEEPMTGYRYGGVLVSNADIGYQGNTEPKMPYGNTHGGLVEINGQWYIFYHRQTHGIECCRQGCAEPVTLNEDGTFSQAEMTSCGLNGKPLEGIGTYNATYACHLTHESIGKERYTIRKCVRGVQPHFFEERLDDQEEHNIQYIANMKDGTIAGFKYFHLGTAKHISIEASALGKCDMKIFIDEQCTKEVASIVIGKTDGWKVFHSKFDAPEGNYPLFFKLIGDTVVDWKEFTLY
ncbi:MAG: family 43 glycosylhydrolase [Lachnospira sp.]|nr:family 43 glycosylhydrolase [Lachnospira sp.]